MRGLAELQKEKKLPVQSHLSENPGEIAWVKELCPNVSNYSEAYEQFGLFGGDCPTIMAHCIWMEEDEIEKMKNNQVYVAHCPQSNMNLSSGIAPVRRFLSEGIPTGLGSDMACLLYTSSIPMRRMLNPAIIQTIAARSSRVRFLIFISIPPK